MKIMHKKILVSLLVMLLLLAPVLSVQGAGGLLKGIGKSLFTDVGNVKGYMLLTWLAWVVDSAAKHYSSHLEDYVLMNPDPTHPQVMRVMGFFISLAMAFYVVAIALAGFYFLFISGSARGRAKAKYTLGKLIIGMFFVSISPYLLQLLFQFSGSLTAAILEQGNIKIVTDEFNNALWAGYAGTAVTIFPGLFGLVTPGGLANLKSIARGGKWGGFKLGLSYVSEDAASSFAIYPYFLIIVLILLTFGLLVGRYLTVMIWTILFPLAIFFTSFELTKYSGRIMMEQTLQWTLLQVFYALTLVGLSIGLVLLPEGYKGYSIFFMAFHSIAVVAALFFGPFYLSSLLQKLFPP